jgi:hypothetical protein
VGIALMAAACGGSRSTTLLEAPWAPESTLVVFAFSELGTPDLNRPPSVVSAGRAFELNLDTEPAEGRIAFLEYEAGARATLGIERCGVSLDGIQPALPAPRASFALELQDENSTLSAVAPDWGAVPPRFARCAPSACDSITVSSFILPDLAGWTTRGIVGVDETRVIIRMERTSTSGPGLLMLVDRPDRIVQRLDLPVRSSGMTRLGNAVLIARDDGVLYRTDLELSQLTEVAAVSARLDLEIEPGASSAIAFSYEHADARRIHEDGRVEPAPAQFRDRFHHLVFGPEGRAAAVRYVEPESSDDQAVSRYDGSAWDHLALPPGIDDVKQLRYEGADLIVVAKEAVLSLGPTGPWRRFEQVPPPLVQNFVSIEPLGQGFVLGGHGGLLERFGADSHCVIPSGNHETNSPLLALSSRTVVGGWALTRPSAPHLMWIDDALYDRD